MTAYELRISDWSSDVCSSDLVRIMPLDGAEFRHVVMDGNQHIVAVGVEVLVTLCADLGKPFIPLRLEARQGDLIGVGQDARGFVGISLVPLIGGVGPGPGDDYLAPSLRPRLDLKRVHLLVGKPLAKLGVAGIAVARTDEHTSELQFPMSILYDA